MSDEMNYDGASDADIGDASDFTDDSADVNEHPEALEGETEQETLQRLYRVKIDGEEYEVDEDELTRGYSHARAAAKRMQEAAQVRQEAEQVLRLLRENPREVLKHLGIDPTEQAQRWIREEIEEEMMDPRERELRDMQRRVEQYEQERREAIEQYERQEMERQLAEQTEYVQNDIIQTLDESGLPRNEQTIGRIVYYMQSALSAGYDVSAADVIEHVRNDYKSDVRSLLGSLTDEQLEMYLEPDTFKRIAKRTVSKQMNGNTSVPREVNQQAKRPGKNDRKGLNSFFKDIKGI